MDGIIMIYSCLTSPSYCTNSCLTLSTLLSLFRRHLLMLIFFLSEEDCPFIPSSENAYPFPYGVQLLKTVDFLLIKTSIDSIFVLTGTVFLSWAAVLCGENNIQFNLSVWINLCNDWCLASCGHWVETRGQ